MLKRLLATTAIVAFAGAAQAAEATNTMAAPQPNAAAAAAYLPAIETGDHLASNLIGETVYSGPGDDAETIGEINDLIVGSDGGVDGVVIGVGGFLGIGEKNVAVNFDALQWRTDADGDMVAVLATTKEQLEAAPTFDVSALDPDAAPAPADAAVDVTAAPPVANDAAPAPDAAPMANDMAANPPAADAAPMANDMAANPPAAATDATADAIRTVDAGTVSANDLLNTTVYGADDANVGEVGDVLVNDDGTIDAVIVDVGGFLGLGEKPVAIGFDDVILRLDENENLLVYTTFTREQLDAAPEYEKTAYLENRDALRLTSTN